MRAAIAILLIATLWTGTAAASRAGRIVPLRPIEPSAFAELVQTIKAEGFVDGKLTRLRAAVALQRRTLTCAQLVTVLEAFAFWCDRVAALREAVIGDPANLGLVLHYFDAAPYAERRDARELLGVP